MTKTACSETVSKVKFPSKSVEVPELVPLMATVAPGRGNPSERLLTVPVMALSCAFSCTLHKSHESIVKNKSDLRINLKFKLVYIAVVPTEIRIVYNT